jgi:hypothetical protein
MRGPREDPEDKRDRERQRRMARIERREAAQGNARSLTGDLFSLFGRAKDPQ